MLYVSCFGSHQRAAVFYMRDFLYETALKDALHEYISSTLDIGPSAPTASLYTPSPIELHFLLILTAVCKQQQAKSIFSLPKSSIYLSCKIFWTHS